MKLFYFEKLEVWQKSRKLTTEMYRMTASFPAEEKFGMTSQIRRASISIVANIAEGISRPTEKDKARFIALAFGSAMEVISLLVIAHDLEWIDEEVYVRLRADLEEISNMLNSLYNKFGKS